MRDAVVLITLCNLSPAPSAFLLKLRGKTYPRPGHSYLMLAMAVHLNLFSHLQRNFTNTSHLHQRLPYLRRLLIPYKTDTYSTSTTYLLQDGQIRRLVRPCPPARLFSRRPSPLHLCSAMAIPQERTTAHHLRNLCWRIRMS